MKGIYGNAISQEKLHHPLKKNPLILPASLPLITDQNRTPKTIEMN